MEDASRGREPDPELAQLASELRIVVGRMIRRLRVEHRVPMTQAAVLGRLGRDGPQSIGELASAESVRPQSMSQTLTELESVGWVERQADASDGRRARIELTDAGREVLGADRARRDGWLAGGIAELDTADQAVLRRATELLQQLIER